MVAVENTKKDTYSLSTSQDLDVLIDRIGESKYVLLGEASHGTHEFYTWRTMITKRLIEEKGFSFIAVEGDWPDCYRVNRLVKGYMNPHTHPIDVLSQFNRWPTWMWANWEVVALAEWIMAFNKNLSDQQKIGFYGLDVYSLWESMDVILNYLRKEDPKAAKLAIEALRCFQPYEEERDYARALLQLSPSCMEEVISLLKKVRQRSYMYDHDREAALNAEMNAQVIANAEQYYRSLVSFRGESWNLRDSHMVSVLESLIKFHGEDAKAIVWEHNTHIGDARYTTMKDQGLWNVGQLIREKHGANNDVYVVGFATYEGTVIAADSWGGEMKEMKVPKAMEGSVEDILHHDSPENKILLLHTSYWKERFNSYIGHRAIGVVYNPGDERGNYVPTLLPSRYDALLYIDQSNALHPLQLMPDKDKAPETYPFGF